MSQAHSLTPDQAAAIKRIKAEWMINSYAFNGDFLLYLSSAWQPMNLESIFGSKRDLLIALGFKLESLCIR